MCKKKTVPITKIIEMYPDNNTARLHLEQRRWNGIVTCPKCNDIRIQNRKRVGWYRCLDCKYDFTVRHGTIFANSKLGLHKWFYAIYYMMVARKSVSSLELCALINVKQSTAWFLMHRIRNAFGNDTTLLSGIIEVDETYIGGLEKNKHASKRTANNQGRSTKTKAAVVGLRSRNGQVRAIAMEQVNSDNIQQFIDANVEKGSTLSTDEARVYMPIQHYKKIVVNHSISQFVDDMAYTNGIESVWAVLKRGYHGTFHHFSKKHLQKYVDEFIFRCNDGHVNVHVLDRMDRVLMRAFNKTITYKQLIGKA